MSKNSSPSNEFSDNFVLFATQIVASVIVALLGLVVIMGWFLNKPILIQIFPSFVPMQFNTALGFLLSGIALLCTILCCRKLTIGLGITIFLIGFLTLSQYIFAIDLRIDELFMHPYIGVKTSHPGRMAPNSALCFALTGFALVASCLRFRLSVITSSILGAIIAALGVVSFFGYIVQIPTAYSWGELTAMAVHTSVGFIIIGGVIVSSLWKKFGGEKQGLSFRLPVLVAIAGITFTLCLWQAVYYQERLSVERETKIEAESFVNAVKTQFTTGVLALERMADRWSVRGGTPQAEWERDAIGYINDYKSYVAIEWIDSNNIVRWALPKEHNEIVIGLDASKLERRRAALEKARAEKTSMMTRTIDLEQGGKGILIYSPIFIDGEFGGFILGVIRLNDFFNLVLPKEFSDEFLIRVFNEDELTFENIPKTQIGNTQYLDIDVKVNNYFETFGIKWQVSVSPKPVASSFSFDDLTLLLGMLISALLAWVTYLYQRTLIDADERAIINDELVGEVKERKKIERAIRENSTFQQAILDGANYMIVSTDVNGIITTFNKTAEKLLGYKAEEVVGKESPEIFHIRDEILDYAKELNEKHGFEFNPGFETFVAKAKRKFDDEREWTYIRKDGSRFPVTLSTTALWNDNGEITGYLGVGKDISELRQANLKLQQSEQTFKAFLENTPVVAYIKDDDFRYIIVNNTFEKRFGVKSEELIGKNSFDWAPKELAESNRKLELQVIENYKVVKEVETFANDDKTTDYWLSIKFPIHNPDGTTYLGGVAIDITESKRLETQLKEARDAALDSVRLKSEFLANMSHEIRTPMNGVLGMTEILLDTTLNTEQLDYAQTIQDSGESLLRIINDILDFSKIEAGKIVFETIDFNLRSAVENITTLFAEEAERKGLEIASLIENDVPTNLQGDPGRLKQVLVNLVGNAIKFTNEGIIYVKVVKVRENDDTATLRFDVIDTGIGMKDEVQKYLFQAFVQADGSMTRKYGGTGLGLAISKQLVELMNGEISIDSTIGKGSTFTFTADFDKQDNPVQDQIIPNENLMGMRALIVDDTATNREIISYQISSWGMLPSEASDASKALRLLKQAASFDKGFDLVFLDLMMPNISGFELAKLIREDSELADVKLILMPSFGKRGHIEDAKTIGIDAYLIKPVRQADLYTCVTNVLGNTTALDNGESKRLITRHSITGKDSGEKLRMLIAEDNVVNQKVSKSQLSNLGYHADVATNGHEVLEALQEYSYSMILMDCQMPEMDGYETTREIRKNEKKDEHIPIVAVTANALLGEKEKCLAAGMDDYLAKPFKQHELRAIIKSCLKLDQITEEITVNKDAISENNLENEFLNGVKDRLTELQDEVGNEMVDMIISLFVEDSFMRVQKMHSLIEEENAEEIAREAHSLKGSSSNVGAINLSEMCSELEINVSVLGKTELEQAFVQIEKSFLKLFEVIKTIELKDSSKLVKS